MYTVLLADDEPIVLAGLHSMLPWKEIQCCVVGTARDGAQAWELIETLNPDMVICDAQMPGLTGFDLMERAAAGGLQTVFVLLTEREDFFLARQALRLRAADCLLKGRLEPETLESAVTLSISECEKRRHTKRAVTLEAMLEKNRESMLASTVSEVLRGGGEDCLVLLRGFGALANCGVVQVISKNREVRWETVKQAARRGFSRVVALPANQRTMSFFVWHLAGAEELLRFQKELGEGFHLLATGRCVGNEAARLKGQTIALEDEYYLRPRPLLVFGEEPPTPTRRLALSALFGRILLEINSRQADKCAALFRQAQELIEKTPHTRREGQRAWMELRAWVSMALPGREDEESAWDQAEDILTRVELLRRIEALRSHVVEHIGVTFIKTDAVETAKNYIKANIQTRLTVRRVAVAAGLSPNYLSSLFKRQLGQSLTDFINNEKIKSACQMLRDRSRRVYEISGLLGYDSAYYFTKVFKRHMGMTPTQYRDSLIS